MALSPFHHLQLPKLFSPDLLPLDIMVRNGGVRHKREFSEKEETISVVQGVVLFLSPAEKKIIVKEGGKKFRNYFFKFETILQSLFSEKQPYTLRLCSIKLINLHFMLKWVRIKRQERLLNCINPVLE